MGLGLLVAVLGWACIAAGWEYVLSIVIQNPDETSTLIIPVFRTIMEFGLLIALVSFALVVLSNVCITLQGGDLIRLQKRITIVGWWHKRLLDGTLTHPTQQIHLRTRLIVRSRTTTTTKHRCFHNIF